MNEDIVWEDPPPLKRGGGRKVGRTMAFVEALKERPGRWARYPFQVSSAAVTHHRHRYPDCEWTARRLPDSTYEVYGRWVGEES